MEIIFFQLLIITSIFIAYRSKEKKGALYLSYFWTLWTFFMVFMPLLMIFQLSVIWITFKYLSNSEKDPKNRIGMLREKNQKDMVASEIKRPVNLKKSGLPKLEINSKSLIEGSQTRKGIKNHEHFNHLIDSIESAEYRLLILSGWVSTSVLSKSTLSKLNAASLRGVDIYIGFGYQDIKKDHLMTLKAQRAFRELVHLSRRVEGNKGKLYIGYFNNHQKVLIRDNHITIGSHNWLSSKYPFNKELSIEFNEPKLSQEFFDYLSIEIMSNDLGII